MWDYHGYGMGAGDWILMVLLAVVLVGLVVFVVMRLSAPHGGSGVSRLEAHGPRTPADDPVEILRRRLARGDIDVTTYDQLREKLEGGGAAADPGGEAEGR